MADGLTAALTALNLIFRISGSQRGGKHSLVALWGDMRRLALIVARFHIRLEYLQHAEAVDSGGHIVKLGLEHNEVAVIAIDGL